MNTQRSITIPRHRVVLAAAVVVAGLLGAGMRPVDLAQPAAVAYPAGCRVQPVDASPVAPTPFLTVAGDADVVETIAEPTAMPVICVNPISIAHVRGEHAVAPGGTVTYGMQAVNESDRPVSFRLELATSAEGWDAWLAAGDRERVITLLPGEAIVFDIVVLAAPYASVHTVNDTRVTAVVVD